MAVVRIAAFQIRYLPDEGRQERIARVLEELRRAPRADLVLIPELWDVGYFAFDSYEEAARPLEAAVDPIRAVARERQAVIVAGSVLERDGVDLYNTCSVAGPDGTILGTYRKRHLFGYHSREAELLTPGTDSGVVETPLGRLGLATCFDLRFPEQFIEMRNARVDLLVVPAAWPAVRADHWDILVRARAIETQTPIVGCNGAGPSEDVELAGGSLIADARGQVLARAGTEEAWLEAALDPEDTRAWREEFPIYSETAVAL